MIETFITVHDQDIIIDYENSNKYSCLNKYRYLFVGDRDISKIKHLQNVIVGRNLEFNIEKFNYFCDYTSWFFWLKTN